MWASPFSEEDEAEDGEETSSGSEVEYSFDGFNIEFSEKVVLMPAGQPPGSGARRDG